MPKSKKDKVEALGISTPSSIQRQINDLLTSWERLAESYPKNKLIKSELAAYRT